MGVTVDESDRRKFMLRGPTGERAGPLYHAEVSRRRKDGEINANWLCSFEPGDMWLPVDRVIDDPEIFDRLEAGGKDNQRRESAESAPRSDSYWAPGSRADPKRLQGRTPPSGMPSVERQEGDLEGLKNWLAVIGLGLWVSFATSFSLAIQLSDIYGGPEWSKLSDEYPSIAMAVNATSLLAWGGFIVGAVCLFLYHTKHYLFPKALIAAYGIAFFLNIIDITAWSQTPNGIGTDQLNAGIMRIMMNIITGIVVIPYLLMSKRVAVTFTQYMPPSTPSRREVASDPIPETDSRDSFRYEEPEASKDQLEQSVQSQQSDPIEQENKPVKKKPSADSRYQLDGRLNEALDQPLVLEHSGDGPAAAVSAVVENLKRIEGQRTGGFLKLTDVRRLGKTLYLKFEADVRPQKENTLRRLFSELLQKEMIKDLGLEQGMVRLMVLHGGEICWEASIRPGKRGMTLKVIT